MDNYTPSKGLPFTCSHCQSHFASIDIVEAINKSSAVCVDCFANGKRLIRTKNTARVCEGCGRKINAGPCYYCAHGIREQAVEYVV